MQITRRSFLKYCTTAAAALGLGPGELAGLRRALANPAAPQVLWLQGSGCSGCSISLLNYVSPTPPNDAADVFIRSLNLLYHPTLSAGAGAAVVGALRQAKDYFLVIEGGVPTAFDGYACTPWSEAGREVTFQAAVKEFAAQARQVICVGTCAAFGGVSAMGANPAQTQKVSTILARKTINVPGCPPHPNWIMATLAPLLQGKTVAVDDLGRPTSVFGGEMCRRCSFHHAGEARQYGVNGQCLQDLGCQGRSADAPCPTMKWNQGVNWCVAAGAPCQGCVLPEYPNTSSRGRRGGPGGRGPGGRTRQTPPGAQ